MPVRSDESDGRDPLVMADGRMMTQSFVSVVSLNYGSLVYRTIRSFRCGILRYCSVL